MAARSSHIDRENARAQARLAQALADRIGEMQRGNRQEDPSYLFQIETVRNLYARIKDFFESPTAAQIKETLENPVVRYPLATLSTLSGLAILAQSKMLTADDLSSFSAFATWARTASLIYNAGGALFFVGCIHFLPREYRPY